MEICWDFKMSCAESLGMHSLCFFLMLPDKQTLTVIEEKCSLKEKHLITRLGQAKSELWEWSKLCNKCQAGQQRANMLAIQANASRIESGKVARIV